MATLIRNADGTTSIKHSKDDIAQANAANAATAEARADRIAADAAHADMMTAARVAALTDAIASDGSE